METAKIANLYSLDHTIAADYLSGYTYPWEALAGIKELIISLGSALDGELYNKIGEDIQDRNRRSYGEHFGSLHYRTPYRGSPLRFYTRQRACG